jgi:hypothetical protein
VDAWHVTICRFGRALDAAEALSKLACISEVCAPFQERSNHRHGRSIERHQPWLGPLVLARWPGDDPHAWHDVNDLAPVVGILGGWPPATVSDAAVERFLGSIQEIESNGHIDPPPPCAAGDIVRFSHLDVFHRVVARCLWAAGGMVGLRLRMLGHDMMLQVPYAAIEAAEAERKRLRLAPPARLAPKDPGGRRGLSGCRAYISNRPAPAL